MEEQFQELEVYSSVSQAALNLKLNENTFTGYYIKFEKQGYTFKRTTDNKVIFSQIEIEMFQDFLDEKNKPRTTIEQAIKTVIEKYVETPETEVSIKKSELATLINMVEKKFQVFEELQKDVQELKEYQKLYLESQEKVKLLEEQKVKERDDLLIQSIRENQEVKRMISELNKNIEEQVEKQVAATKEEKSKKGFLSWFKRA